MNLQTHIGGNTTTYNNHTITFLSDGKMKTLSLLEISDNIELLKQSCDEACFGYKNKAIVDKSVRNAYNMKHDMFNTTLDSYAQSLIPIISQSLVTENTLICERDKLNIYSEHGHFKTHKDTPLRKNMVGTLVLCLPSAFTGGGLAVEHDSEKHLYDWAKHSKTKLQWTAFFSDVNHCVEEVKSGHRVTITYGLYVTEELSNIINDLNISSLSWVDKKVEETTKKGFNFGYLFKHLYGKTPYLKGSDLLIYNYVKQKYNVELVSVIYEPFDFDDDLLLERENGSCIISENYASKMSHEERKELNDGKDIKDYTDYTNDFLYKILKKYSPGIFFYVGENDKLSYISESDNEYENRYELLSDKYIPLFDVLWNKYPNCEYDGESLDDDISCTHHFTACFLYGNYPASNESFYRYWGMIINKK